MESGRERTGAGEAEAGEAALLERARNGDEDAFRDLVLSHHGELRAYCYQMLGSVADAEDAVQNALLRAWRSLGGFEGRGSVRSWLYSIATNTALDIVRHRSRRELPADFGPAAAVGAPLADPVLDPVWLEPYPDRWVSGGSGGPADFAAPEARYERRESLEIAFMVMLQHLPPLQRAVLILRDVLSFSAAESAAQLSTTVAAVNSALQRARAAACAGLPAHSQQSALRSLDDAQIAALAGRYASALESADVDTLLGLLTQDATWSMPPIPTWYAGHEALRPWLLRYPLSQRWRHVPTRANGQLAMGCYLYSPESGRYEAWVLDVLTLAVSGSGSGPGPGPGSGSGPGVKIAAVTAFMVRESGSDPEAVFGRFGLPAFVS